MDALRETGRRDRADHAARDLAAGDVPGDAVHQVASDGHARSVAGSRDEAQVSTRRGWGRAVEKAEGTGTIPCGRLQGWRFAHADRPRSRRRTSRGPRRRPDRLDRLASSPPERSQRPRRGRERSRYVRKRTHPRRGVRRSHGDDRRRSQTASARRAGESVGEGGRHGRHARGALRRQPDDDRLDVHDAGRHRTWRPGVDARRGPPRLGIGEARDIQGRADRSLRER